MRRGREEEGVGGGESWVEGDGEDRVLLIWGIVEGEWRRSDTNCHSVAFLTPFEPRRIPREETMLLARAVPTQALKVLSSMSCVVGEGERVLRVDKRDDGDGPDGDGEPFCCSLCAELWRRNRQW